MGLYFPTNYIVRYYDSRRVFEIMSDTGETETPASYQYNTRYLEAIRSTEAEVDEMLQVGGHYDKQTLLDACAAANSSTGGIGGLEISKRRVAPLREMIAHLVFGKLMAARGYSADEMRQLAPMYDTALERLERLASGQHVFDIVANISAGVPKRVLLGSQLPSGINNNPLFGIWPSQYNDGLYGYRW